MGTDLGAQSGWRDQKCGTVPAEAVRAGSRQRAG